jgi:uncharacterized damage-inducible protein DinB
MTWTAPEADRPHTPKNADERASLQGFLDHHRGTLLQKCAGLTDSHLRRRAVEPSGLSLLGLVRHMTEVERGWFRRRIGGDPSIPELYCTPENPDGDFDDVDTADAEAAFAAYTEEIALADAAAAPHDLGETFTSRRGQQLSVRWAYLHMIEEYARHNGHADLLRERIDGATSE